MENYNMDKSCIKELLCSLHPSLNIILTFIVSVRGGNTLGVTWYQYLCASANFLLHLILSYLIQP